MSFVDTIEKRQESQKAWREGKKQERDDVNILADNGVSLITSDPESYADYLKLQVANLSFSPQNLAIVLMREPNAQQIHKRDTWEKKGRNIIPTERDNGIKVFLPMDEKEKARQGFTGNPTVIGMVYDISQTTGRELEKKRLLSGAPMINEAIGGFVAASKAEIIFDESLESAALYNPETQKLLVNPTKDPKEVFVDLSREFVYANRHRGGEGFQKGWCDLEAASVSYMLCNHFLGESQLPDVSSVTEKFDGMPLNMRRKVLEGTMGNFNKAKNCIDRQIKQSERAVPTPAPRKKKEKAEPAIV